MITKDKVRGCFLGVGIGDAIGMPCEGWDTAKIKEIYGRIETYLPPQGHKYHDGMRAGDTTDDTFLTVAVAKSLIAAGEFNMDSQAKYHVEAFHENTSGWGRTTREAIGRLAAGTHWKEAGNFTSTGKYPKGFGNGMPMKVAPIGAMLAAIEWDHKDVLDKLADFTGMTHGTSMAMSSCLAHTFAVYHCMNSEIFNTKTFIADVVNASEMGKKYYPDTMNDDDITERFKALNPKATTKEIITAFKGTYYVYDSLPFTYAFFVRNPTSIEELYECASAGGDTDSNASMLGSLLGALNGTAIFPKALVDGLECKNELIKLADAFSEKFGV